MVENQEKKVLNEPSRGEKGKRITNTIVLGLGIALVVLSLYQISVVTSLNKETADLYEQIDDLHLLKQRCEQIGYEYDDLYFELLQLDYSMNEKNASGLITEAEADINIDAFTVEYSRMFELFLKQFFVEDEITADWYHVRSDCKWLFYENETLESEYMEMEEGVVFYLYNMEGATEAFFDTTNMITDTLNATDFTYNKTYDILLDALSDGTYVWLWVDSEFFEATISIKEDELAEREYEGDAITLALNANTMSILILSFFIDVKENKAWRIIYLIVAFALGIISFSFLYFA